jgi:hypothetical protein
MHEYKASTFRAKLFKKNRLLDPEDVSNMLCCNIGINLLFKTSNLQHIYALPT